MNLHEEFKKLKHPSDLKDELINFIEKCIKEGHNKSQGYTYYIENYSVMVCGEYDHTSDGPIDELDLEEIYEMAYFLNKYILRHERYPN